jgi:hypothetical protein
MGARPTKRDLLEQKLQTVGTIDEETWARLKRELAPVSDSYLHTLLKHSGRAMAPLVEGVNVSSLDDAERTLRALCSEHGEADITRKKACRAVVIAAKQKLRWSLQRAVREDASRPAKEEILLWTATWLENPAVFPEWIVLRRQLLTEARTIPP